MLLSKMIEEGQRLLAKHGDLQVTCTHSMIEDGHDRHGKPSSLPDSYETTAENLLIVKTKPDVFGDKHVRITL